MLPLLCCCQYRCVVVAGVDDDVDVDVDDDDDDDDEGEKRGMFWPASLPTFREGKIGPQQGGREKGGRAMFRGPSPSPSPVCRAAAPFPSSLLAT